MNLAQAEADDIRLRAEEDSEAMHAQVAQEVERSRNAADTYAQETRSKADNDAVRVLMQAKSDAEELLDAASRRRAVRKPRPSLSGSEPRPVPPLLSSRLPSRSAATEQPRSSHSRWPTTSVP